MLSPHSNGLFHRLIAESGTPLSPSWSYFSPERGLNFGQQITNKVGCDHFWILDKGGVKYQKVLLFNLPHAPQNEPDN